MKVLIAIDNSHCSHEAIKEVLTRPWKKNTKFRIVHVLEPIVTQFAMVAPQAVGLMVNAEKILRQQAEKFTAAAADKLEHTFHRDNISTRIIDGFVADSIIEHARVWKADLIVVGSHGRTGMDRLLLGSVAEKVVTHASCSVDVVKTRTSSRECCQSDTAAQNLIATKAGEKQNSLVN